MPNSIEMTTSEYKTLYLCAIVQKAQLINRSKYMAQRDVQNAALHDRVIAEAVKVLNQKDFDIYTNPGSEKNAWIGDNYPDIIMTQKGTSDIKFIIEVETSDSVNMHEAETQWKKYANEIKTTFYLLVPESFAFKAKQLAGQVGINVRFATFDALPSGQINIKFD